MTDEKEMIFLYILARQGGLVAPVEVKSRLVGEELGLSQQTASRRLITLEKKGWISRKVFGKSQNISITTSGRDTLLSFYMELKRLFGSFEGPQVVRGELVSGLGEGAYYMGQKDYATQFKTQLGFEPFPGTFNLELDEANKELINQLFASKPMIHIDGFQSGGRSFGPVECIKGEIQKMPCAILRIERTHHEKKVIEIIAPKNLRQAFTAKDGDFFEVMVT